MELIIFVIGILVFKSTVKMFKERKHLEKSMKPPKRKHIKSIMLKDYLLGFLFTLFFVIMLGAFELVEHLF